MIPRYERKDNGIALVVLVIAAIPLIGLLCLAFDAGIYLTSAAQLNRAAQNAALAAMSRYLLELDRPSPPTDVVARQIARDQAENVLRSNSFLGNAFREKPSAYPPAEIGTGMSFEGGEGKISFGRYYPEILPISHSDYDAVVAICGPDASDYPCYAEGLGAPNTAVRVTVHTGKTGQSRNPLVPVFGKLLGAPPITLEVHATATRVMQNFSFLVDLSNSVAGTNHLRGGIRDDNPWPHPSGSCNSNQWFIDPQCAFFGTPSSFAYQMAESGVCNDFASSNPSVCCNTGNCLLASSGEGYPWDDHPSGYPTGIWTRYRDFWLRQCTERSQANCPDPDLGFDSPVGSPDGREAIAGDLDAYPAFHPMEDYRPVAANFGNKLFIADDGNPRTDGGSLPFLIDFARFSSDPPCSDQFCARPEPLLSILSGVGTAMIEIEDRKIPGDRFMFSAFDEFLYRNRISCELTSGAPSALCPQDATTTKLVRPNDDANSEFKIFKDLLAEDALVNPGGGSPVVDFLARGIFPRPLNTDGALALWDAALEINKVTTSKLAKNMLFVFTDGHFNCGLNQNFASIPEYLSSGSHSCASSGIKVWQSLLQLTNFQGPGDKSLVELLQDGKVSATVFLFGPGSHRLLRRSQFTAGGCMTESESVSTQCADGSCLVNSGRGEYQCEYDGGCVDEAGLNQEFLKLMAGTESNFYLQNELYEILVKPTRGRWVPIPPVIPFSVNPPGPDEFSFVDQLDDICNQMGMGEVVTNAESNPNLKITLEDGSLFAVTDNDGRLLYDPLGRSPSVQIGSVIKEVMDAGFSLIEPKN